MNINLQKLEDFLKENPRNTIIIYNPDTGIDILDRVEVNNAYIFEKYGDIESFFIALKNDYNLTKIGVQKKKSNGTSSKRKDFPIIFNLGTKKPLEEGAVKGTTTQTSVVPDTANINTMPRSYEHQYPQSQGLNAVQIAKMISNEDKLELYKERIEELKANLKTQEQKTARKESEIESLTIDLRKSNSDLANAAQKMELEILKEQIKKEPSIPPEIYGKLMDVLPSILGSLNTNKVANAGVGLSGSQQNISQVKKDLIEFIADPKTTDEDANFFFHALYGIQSVVVFKNEVTQLIETHNIKDAFK